MESIKKYLYWAGIIVLGSLALLVGLAGLAIICASILLFTVTAVAGAVILWIGFMPVILWCAFLDPVGFALVRDGVSSPENMDITE